MTLITEVLDDARVASARAYLDALIAEGGRLKMRLGGDPSWTYFTGEVRMPDGRTIHGAAGLTQESFVVRLAQQAGWLG